MTPDPDLRQRYADLLAGDADANLAPLLGDLEALHTVHDPPASLERALERAIRVQADEQPATVRALTRTPRTIRLIQRERQAAMTPRRISTFAACAAAIAVVALFAALLHGAAPSSTSGPASSGHGPTGPGTHPTSGAVCGQATPPPTPAATPTLGPTPTPHPAAPVTSGNVSPCPTPTLGPFDSGTPTPTLGPVGSGQSTPTPGPTPIPTATAHP